MNRVVTYKEYGEMMYGLINQLVFYKQNLKQVYGPPRGGLPMAVHIAHHLDLCFMTNIYGSGGRLLVVDGVVDSGKQLMEIKARHPKIWTATLFYKPKTSAFKPDLYVEETDKYIDFPWENPDG